MTDQGVIRVNVSVPKAVKARMDEVGRQVNWSAVATQAFEEKLLELESKKEVGSMDDVLARMKAADELDSKEEYLEGREAGERWTRGDARPGQLRRLAVWGDGECDLDETLKMFEERHKNIARGLYMKLENVREDDLESRALYAFWESALGKGRASDIQDRNFARGFCEGALEVWDMVKDQL